MYSNKTLTTLLVPVVPCFMLFILVLFEIPMNATGSDKGFDDMEKYEYGLWYKDDAKNQMLTNKALARACIDVWNGDDPKAWNDVCCEKFVRHHVEGDYSLKEWKDLHSGIRHDFPDGKAIIEDMIAEGDKVVVRLTFKGTYMGDAFGSAAKGKTVIMPAYHMMRIVDNRLVEEWVLADSMELRRQLGVE